MFDITDVNIKISAKYKFHEKYTEMINTFKGEFVVEF